MVNTLAVDYTIPDFSNVTSVGTLGLLALSVFGFPPFAAYEFPTPTVRVRVTVALNVFHSMNADGDAPDLRLWTEEGMLSGGMVDVGHINEGSWGDYYVPLGPATQRPTYLLMTANNNAVCVASVQQAKTDEPEYAWMGNWGRTCEQDWYHSGLTNNGKAVECSWIDKNGDRDNTGIGFHWPDFLEEREHDYDAK